MTNSNENPNELYIDSSPVIELSPPDFPEVEMKDKSSETNTSPSLQATYSEEGQVAYNPDSIVSPDEDGITIIQSADIPEQDDYFPLDDLFPTIPTDEIVYHYSDEQTAPEYDGYDDDNGYMPEAPVERQRTRNRKGNDRKQKKKGSVGKAILNGVLVFATVMAAFYLLVVYSSIPILVSLRNMYIQTAMATLNHKYLATALFPSELIDELMLRQYEAEYNSVGLSSNWGNVQTQALPDFNNDQNKDPALPENTDQTTPEDNSTIIMEDDNGSGRNYSSEDERVFFERFYEIDYDSMQEYIAENPDVLSNGWANININEAGLDDYGTSIETVHGDQILAINAAEGVVLIRVYINSSRGVMAICKDTSRLNLCVASTLGTIGQTAGRICEANDGILSITGSAFMDDGNGDGGQISGLAVCGGYYYGDRLGGTDKRIELRTDNRMYIVDSVASVAPDTRDACEFRPALIIDGEVVVDEDCGWTGPNPRSVLGQSGKLETMMFILEGRYADSPGDSVVDIAYFMQNYGCVQAMNLDGGTSSIMYYDGEYITRCSNEALPGGRTLPSAWVYHRAY